MSVITLKLVSSEEENYFQTFLCVIPFGFRRSRISMKNKTRKELISDTRYKPIDYSVLLFDLNSQKEVKPNLSGA